MATRNLSPDYQVVFRSHVPESEVNLSPEGIQAAQRLATAKAAIDSIFQFDALGELPMDSILYRCMNCDAVLEYTDVPNDTQRKMNRNIIRMYIASHFRNYIDRMIP